MHVLTSPRTCQHIGSHWGDFPSLIYTKSIFPQIQFLSIALISLTFNTKSSPNPEAKKKSNKKSRKLIFCWGIIYIGWVSPQRIHRFFQTVASCQGRSGSAFSWWLPFLWRSSLTTDPSISLAQLLRVHSLDFDTKDSNKKPGNTGVEWWGALCFFWCCRGRFWEIKRGGFQPGKNGWGSQQPLSRKNKHDLTSPVILKGFSVSKWPDFCWKLG